MEVCQANYGFGRYNFLAWIENKYFIKLNMDQWDINIQLYYDSQTFRLS